VLIVVATVFFATSTYVGIRWMIRVSYVLVPLIMALGVWAIVMLAQSTNARFGFGEETISVTTGISIVVGTWIMGCLTCMQDLTRFSRSARAGAITAALGILLANSFSLLVGAAGASLSNESDPAKILLAFGLLLPAIVFSFANIWNTNDNNLYSASLHIANMFGLSRHKAVILCVVIGAAFGLVEPYRLSVIFSFLGFMGNTAPALGAVVLTRYWLIADHPRGGKASIGAWCGWIGGSALAITIGGNFAFVIGFIAGSIIYVVMMRVLGFKVSVKPREAESPVNISP
jgi:cytosine permease